MLSNGLQVLQEHNAETSSFFFYSNLESTNASAFDVNLVYFGDLNSFTAWQWNPQGDLLVNFYYKDEGQTLKASGKLNSEVLNDYVIGLESEKQLVVSIGRIEGIEKALKISSNAGSEIEVSEGRIEFSVSMQLPFQPSVSCTYPASVSFKQLNVLVEKNFKPASLET